MTGPLGLRTITRVNPMGLKYYITPHPTKSDVTIVSNNGTSLDIDMQFDDFTQAWFNWQMKAWYIQVAFAKLNAEQREFLMTGITPAQWNEIFKDKE